MKELNDSKHQEINATPENEDLFHHDAAQPDMTLSESSGITDIENDIAIDASLMNEDIAATESNDSKKEEEDTEFKTIEEEFAQADFSFFASKNDLQSESTASDRDLIKTAEADTTMLEDKKEKVVVATMPSHTLFKAKETADIDEKEAAIIDTEITADDIQPTENAEAAPSADETADDDVIDDETVNENIVDAEADEDEIIDIDNEVEAFYDEMPSTLSQQTKRLAPNEIPTSRSKHRRNVWDILLSLLLLFITCFFLYRLYTVSILSFGWIWKITLMIAVVELALFLTVVLCRFPKWALWLRRIFISLLCILFAFAGITINNLQNSLQDITRPETATTVNVSLITKKDGGAKILSELSGKKIGIQNANDAANSSYVQEQLDKEKDLDHVTYVEGLDYESLYKKLINEEIDALIITDYYFKTLLKEDYPTIEDDIFILKSYQKQKEVNLSTSNKDIRYEPFTVYLAGVDEGDDPSIDARSDVNIVLIVNPLANHIEMVSIPRDSFVPNPALYGNNDKLTHLGLNGVENSMEGLEAVLGFEIDYYVKLNFFSVIDIVDAIGKIEVDVPVSFCEQDENRSFAQKDLICLNKGVQRIDGKQALAFARHRKSYTDVMRGKAQQEVIKGIINELTTPSGVANINQVLKIASNTISTNMPMEQVTNFVSAQIDHLKPWTIDSIILENGLDAKLVTASMPGQELYVMLLNRLDIQKVYETYQSMVNQMQFSAFTFHLDHLSKESHELPEVPGIVWAGTDVSGHQLNQPNESGIQESVPQESEPEPTPVEPSPLPDTPDSTTPPDEEPDVPDPIDPTPDEPVEPTPPSTDNPPVTNP